MHDCSAGGMLCITVNGKLILEDTRYVQSDYCIADFQVNYCPFCGWESEVTRDDKDSDDS